MDLENPFPSHLGDPFPPSPGLDWGQRTNTLSSCCHHGTDASRQPRQPAVQGGDRRAGCGSQLSPAQQPPSGVRLRSCWGKLSGNLWKIWAVRGNLLETPHAALWIDTVLLQAAIFKTYTVGLAASSPASASSWLQWYAVGSVRGLLPALANMGTHTICCTSFLDKNKIKKIGERRPQMGKTMHLD